MQSNRNLTVGLVDTLRQLSHDVLTYYEADKGLAKK